MAEHEVVNETATPPIAAPGEADRSEGVASPSGVQIVTVIYSHGRDLYRVAPYEASKRMWLSVAKLPLPMLEPLEARTPYLGAIRCGAGWRKAYSIDWSVVQPGITATLPATDELVVDYAAAELPSSALPVPALASLTRPLPGQGDALREARAGGSEHGAGESAGRGEEVK